MLHVLEDGDDRSYLHDQVLQSLPKIGAPVVEPVLAAYAGSADPRSKHSIATVLAATQIQDDRVFAVLIDNLRNDASVGAADLAEYGDPRAIEHLSRALDECPIDQREGLFTNQAFVELRAAIEELGGSLSATQELRFRRALEPADAVRRKLNAALQMRKAAPAPAAAAAVRPGRNDRCWCGSSTKYKKCHLAADERSAAAGARTS
jgi:SEC-C motif